MNMFAPKTPLQWLRLWRLYRSAFPDAERKPFTMILSMYRQGRTDVWYFEREGKFAGLATTINGDRLILVDYLAVAEGRRGQGLGSEIMALLEGQYAETGFFGEIERVWEKAENYRQRRRRKEFYLSNGMEALGVNVVVFGVDMELLGYRCRVSYEEYREFYREHYGEFTQKHIAKGED